MKLWNVAETRSTKWENTRKIGLLAAPISFSRASAFVDDHFGQISLDDVHVRPEIYEGHAGKLGGCAAGLVMHHQVVRRRIRC